MRNIVILVPVLLFLILPCSALGQSIEELVEKLAEPAEAPGAVFKIAEKLSQGGENAEKAAGPLKKALSSGKSGVRYHALWALTLSGLKVPETAIESLFEDKNSLVRMRAVFSAATLVPGRNELVIKRLSSDKDWLVRAAAATVLADSREPEVTQALLKSLEKHKNSFAAVSLVSHGKKALPGLLKLLASGDKDVKSLACVALGRIGDESSLDSLSRAARDKNPDVAVSASVALALMNQDEAFALLKAALEKRGQSAEGIDESLRQVVRAVAVLRKEAPSSNAKTLKSLGRFGFLPPVPELIEELRRGKSVQSRRAAAEALGDIGSEFALGALAGAASENESAVRQAVAVALGKIASNRGVAPLKQLAYDPDSQVRAAAVLALSKLDTRDLSSIFKRMSRDREAAVRRVAYAAMAGYPPSFTEPVFISLIKKEKDPELKALLVRLLGKIGTDNALIIVLKQADSKKDIVRAEAVLALGNFKQDIAAQKLISVIKKPGTIGHKVFAVRGLGGTGNALAVPVLIDTLRAGGDELVPAAAEALGEIGAKNAVPALKEALAKSDEETAATIIESLGKIAAPESLPELIAFARDKSRSFEIRNTAIRAIGRFKGNDMAKTVVTGFLSQGELAPAAAVALHMHGDNSGIAVLGSFLKKKETSDRLRAVDALREMKVEEADILLLAAARDSDIVVSVTACLELVIREKPEALAILQSRLARKEAYEKFREIMKKFELEKVLNSLMEKLGATKDLVKRTAIVELLERMDIADFRVPKDAASAEYDNLAGKWLRWWKSTSGKPGDTENKKSRK